MKVLSVEIIEPNRRERISGGVCIEFESTENVKKGDYFKVKVDGFNYSFKANGIKVVGEKLIVKAMEVDYYAHKLDYKGVDLRLVIGCEVIPVTDKNEISAIIERSCWC